ncbi:hypothetical protein MMC31_005629 [Peltigera leucophlebia]|nr:hypothetical protein [Peltigera leucophlebia]
MNLSENIESRVDAIIQPEISTEWESELAPITEAFCNDFIDVLKGASREDDSVEPIHHALTSIDRKSEFMFPGEAGISHSAPSAHDDAADESLNRPNKRQQAESCYASPDNSEPTVPPPQPPSKPDISVVKTPRPDITADLRHKIIIGEMKAQCLRELEVKDFLKGIPYQQTLC